MPRKADAQLEDRILDAAYELWSKRGEKALTMRAVARAAGTTTPTVYKRFEDKRDLLALLRERALNKLVSVPSLSGVCGHSSVRVPAAHLGLGRATLASQRVPADFRNHQEAAGRAVGRRSGGSRPAGACAGRASARHRNHADGRGRSTSGGAATSQHLQRSLRGANRERGGEEGRAPRLDELGRSRRKP